MATSERETRLLRRHDNKGTLTRPRSRPRGKRQLGSMLGSNSWAPSQYRAESRQSRPTSSQVAPARSYLKQNSNPSKLHGQGTSSMYSLHSSSFSGLGRLPITNTVKLAPRSQSSLAFTSKWSTTSETSTGSLSPPQGFDLASYVKQHKSTKGIIIGRNGQTTKDEYFDAYLLQCEEELAGKHSDHNSELEGSLVTDEKWHPVSRSGPVPLCWEDQLSIAEPETLRYSIPSKPQRSPYGTQIPNTKDLLERVRVQIILNEHCLLDTTSIRALQNSVDTETVNGVHGRVKTASQHFEVINEITSKAGSPVSDHPVVHGACSQLDLDILEVLFYSEDLQTQQVIEKQMYDVFLTRQPASACSSIAQTTREVLMSSTKAFTNLSARRAFECVSVLEVDIGEELVRRLFHDSGSSSCEQDVCKVSLLCTFGRPRSVLFSVKLDPIAVSKLSANMPSSSEFESQLQSKSTSSENAITWGMSEVPEKFLYKRTNYCSQEDDEDRMDLAAISAYLPELRLSSSTSSGGDSSLTLSTLDARPLPQQSLPHRHKSTPRTGVTTNEDLQHAQTELPSSQNPPTRCSVHSISDGMPQQAPKTITVPSGGEKSKYRPASLKFTHKVSQPHSDNHHGTGTYSMIVKGTLFTYGH